MNTKQKRSIAENLLKKAYQKHMDGNIPAAINEYKPSIELHPTARAHTYLGWAYSLIGKYEEAIEQCLIAIDIDPDFGNPYNDIGSYLINLGRHEEAIDWLEKAMDAPVYEPRHFPFYNMGIVFERRGDWETALNYYNNALELAADYEPARKALFKMVSLLN
jgi:Tfp pilus assembly protein PilF